MTIEYMTLILSGIIFIIGFLQWFSGFRYKIAAEKLNSKVNAYHDYLIKISAITRNLMGDVYVYQLTNSKALNIYMEEIRSLYNTIDFYEYKSKDEYDAYIESVIIFAASRYSTTVIDNLTNTMIVLSTSIENASDELAGLRLNASDEVEKCIVKLKSIACTRSNLVKTFTIDYFKDLFGELNCEFTKSIDQIYIELQRYIPELYEAKEELLTLMRHEVQELRKEVYREN